MKINRILFIVIALIIAIPAIVFLFSKNNIGTPIKTSEPAPTQKPIGVCQQFEKASYSLSCQKAVELALANTEGKVTNAVIGPFKFNPVDAKTLGKSEETMWVVDVELKNPFTTLSGREINVFRIGIPLDGTNAIYRLPIKI